MQKTATFSLRRAPGALGILCVGAALLMTLPAHADAPDGIVVPGDQPPEGPRLDGVVAPGDKPPRGPRVDAMSEEGDLPDGIVAPGEQPPKGPRLDGMSAQVATPLFSLGWQPLPMGAWLALVWQR